jgi:non-homologous end joining protein Ku
VKIWDDSILETEVQRFHDSDMDEFIDAIQQNITVIHYNASYFLGPINE